MTILALDSQVLTKKTCAITFWGLEFPIILIFTSICDFIHNANGVGALKTE
jgi:hypothetical protein